MTVAYDAAGQTGRYEILVMLSLLPPHLDEHANPGAVAPTALDYDYEHRFAEHEHGVRSPCPLIFTELLVHIFACCSASPGTVS